MKYEIRNRQIVDMYVQQELGSNIIAEKLGISRSYVYNFLKKNNYIRPKDESTTLGAYKRKGMRISDEQKLKISTSMKRVHREGKHPGWTHINTDPLRRSYPEKIFMHNLHSYGLTSQYTFIEQLPIGKYFLDFALIDLKIDIEIDGSQHAYNQEHDQVRDKFLNDHGWKIYRISWNELKSNYDRSMKDLITYIETSDLCSNRYYEISEVKLSPVKKFNSWDEYNECRLHEAMQSNQPKIDLVLESDIDFTKFGWVSKVANILDIQPQRVNRWMKKYMNEFYETKCFRRK